MLINVARTEWLLPCLSVCALFYWFLAYSLVCLCVSVCVCGYNVVCVYDCRKLSHPSSICLRTATVLSPVFVTSGNRCPLLFAGPVSGLSISVSRAGPSMTCVNFRQHRISNLSREPTLCRCGGKYAHGKSAYARFPLTTDWRKITWQSQQRSPVPHGCSFGRVRFSVSFLLLLLWARWQRSRGETGNTKRPFANTGRKRVYQLVSIYQSAGIYQFNQSFCFLKAGLHWSYSQA